MRHELAVIYTHIADGYEGAVHGYCEFTTPRVGVRTLTTGNKCARPSLSSSVLDGMSTCLSLAAVNHGDLPSNENPPSAPSQL